LVESVFIDGKEHNVADFPLGDLEWLEEYLGFDLDDERALKSMKAAVAFVYLVKKQDDPEYTLDMARAEKVSVLNGPDEDPADTQVKRPPTRAARR
jgi:hypothetical protein